MIISTISTYFVIITFLWCIYLETFVGGILLRPDAKGNKHLHIMGFFNQLWWPLTDYNAWRPEFWDLNYYMVIGWAYLIKALHS